jgi:ABC-type phosphate transport system permease subunit
MSLPPPPAAPPPPPGFDYGAGAPAITSSKATGALVCGIIGLLVCGVILGPVAIYLGTQAKREIGLSNGRLKGEGMATAGIVMGIIAIIGFVISIIYFASR